VRRPYSMISQTYVQQACQSCTKRRSTHSKKPYVTLTCHMISRYARKCNVLTSVRKVVPFLYRFSQNCQMLKNRKRTCICSVSNLYRSATIYVRYRQTFTYALKPTRTLTEPLFKKILLTWHFVKPLVKIFTKTPLIV